MVTCQSLLAEICHLKVCANDSSDEFGSLSRSAEAMHKSLRNMMGVMSGSVDTLANRLAQ